jgi:glutamate/aspartate transport system substrate-binding protein
VAGHLARAAVAACCLAVLLGAAPGRADELTGTLKAIHDRGRVVIGYREDALPFSYRPRPESAPIGYSIELCREIVDEITAELDGRELGVEYRPVTAADRIRRVAGGEIDLECGTTTSSVARRREVAFSPIIFVAGTKLLVRKGSGIRSYRDLAGKTVVVTAGTTNEAALRTLARKQNLALDVVAAGSHDESFRRFAAGEADAFATDDVLLYGKLAGAAAAADYQVVGDYLSYDPYGIMYRKDDPALDAVVERTFRRLAESRELAQIYERWFQRRLPTGERLDLPMSPQLEEMFRMLGLPE